MDQTWKHIRSECVIKFLIILCFANLIESHSNNARKLTFLDKALKRYIDQIFTTDDYNLLPGISIAKTSNGTDDTKSWLPNKSVEEFINVEKYFYKKLDKYVKSHLVTVNVPTTARLFALDTGKSSFLAGFGMGFLAFSLKKLLLPVFIGAQIIKSVLIALFLPSILGSVGKLLGKGLSSFSGSGSSGLGGGNPQQVEDFEFKDTSPYNSDDPNQDFNAAEGTYNLDMSSSTTSPDAMNRFGQGNQRISDNYYFRQPAKKTDYKVFHKIPPSSMLLTTYDPFYSPLLSRLDAVFQQLGFGNDKLPDTEPCRERLVCLMYSNPAKYAPYSNLVSAQLSRELNELRKPSSDNPEILRFFRYMKAAKDGQDGDECVAHSGCPSLTSDKPSPAMLTTYNDINKLVLARKLK